MNWLAINTVDQIQQEIVKQSYNLDYKTVLLFKHSTRCAISKMAKDRLERSWTYSETQVPTYYLDLLNYREVSTAIAAELAVQHESPQVLLIKNGVCVAHFNHGDITVPMLEEAIDRIMPN